MIGAEVRGASSVTPLRRAAPPVTALIKHAGGGKPKPPAPGQVELLRCYLTVNSVAALSLPASSTTTSDSFSSAQAASEVENAP